MLRLLILLQLLMLGMLCHVDWCWSVKLSSWIGALGHRLAIVIWEENAMVGRQDLRSCRLEEMISGLLLNPSAVLYAVDVRLVVRVVDFLRLKFSSSRIFG
jgi:hypothetical protein